MMSFFDSFFGSMGSGLGRAVAYVLIAVILIGGGYAFYRYWAPGPDPDPQDVTEVAPGLPPILDESTIARPDSGGEWVIETVPGDFDATLTIDLPDSDSAANEQEYVSIGLREGAEQFFPELPGQRKLPLDAVVIGPYGEENVRIKAQPQPIIAFDLQAELGLSLFASDAQTGGAVGVTAARLFGVRLGGFVAAAPKGGSDRLEVQVGTGPYASLRVYGPFGVGIGKDLTSDPLTSLEGLTFTITADLPLL